MLETLTTTASPTDTTGTISSVSPTPTVPPLLPPPVTNNSLFQCWTSWNNAAVEWAWADQHRTPSTIPYTTSISTYVVWDTLAPFTTLCDGVPRALKPPVQTTSLFSTITNYNVTQTVWPMPPLTYSSVDCGFCDRCADCNSISQFIAYSSSVWSQQLEPRTPSTLSLWLPCAAGTPTPYGPTTPVIFPTATNGPSCLIRPVQNEGTLFYWPVTTVSGDFCKQNGSTVTPTPTASDSSPNTAVYNGLTLTSPTAVLVIDALSAIVQYESRRRSSYTSLGPEYTSATISLHPSSISTVTYGGQRLRVGQPLSSYSLNFADLNTVPYSVYSKQYCNNEYGNCERIWKVYTPKVGVPTGLDELKPDWKFCTGWGSVEPQLVPVTPGVTTSVSKTADATRPQETSADEVEGEERNGNGAIRTSDGW